MKRILEQPKLKYKVDFKDLKKILNIPTVSGTFKKGDIIELVDEKTGISKRCKIKKIENLKDNPHYNKTHYLPPLFESIIIETT